MIVFQYLRYSPKLSAPSIYSSQRSDMTLIIISSNNHIYDQSHVYSVCNVCVCVCVFDTRDGSKEVPRDVSVNIIKGFMKQEKSIIKLNYT